MLTPIRFGLFVVPCAMFLGLVVIPAQAGTEPKECGYFDTQTLTYVACAARTSTMSSDPAPAQAQKADRHEGTSSGGTDDPPCYYQDLEVLPAESSVWSYFIPRGADPADYKLVLADCAPSGRTRSIFAVRVRNSPAPPSAAVVSREAIARLLIPLPAIGVGPNINRVAVNVPIWLWVSNSAAVSASATDRTVSVTATAVLRSVTWSMGEPDARPFTCQGAGVAPWPSADLWKPPCGYTYRLRSLDSRTDGAGVWPVTAVASWAITWRANTGQSGSDTVTTRSTVGLDVGEYRTVIVAGTG